MFTENLDFSFTEKVDSKQNTPLGQYSQFFRIKGKKMLKNTVSEQNPIFTIKFSLLNITVNHC